MSHIVTIRTEIRDAAALAAACSRQRLPPPVYGTAKLFSTTVTGWQVRLPAWRYPLVCQTETGTVHYDNFQGRWGEPRFLDAFLQRYAVEKARIEAQRQGYGVMEQPLADGSIKLTLQMGVIQCH